MILFTEDQGTGLLQRFLQRMLLSAMYAIHSSNNITTLTSGSGCRVYLRRLLLSTARCWQWWVSLDHDLCVSLGRQGNHCVYVCVCARECTCVRLCVVVRVCVCVHCECDCACAIACMHVHAHKKGQILVLAKQI